MSLSIEKAPPVETSNSDLEFHDARTPFSSNRNREIPNTWKYKPPSFFGLFELPHYASPSIQLFLVSLISFLNPGIYNALNGLGGAGQLNAHDLDLAQTALYATFAVVAFNSGSVANVIGLRHTLLYGALGYTVFSSSLLCYNHTQNAGFVIFAGVFLGWSAGLLWTAQGAIMMSYPSEDSKGRFISWFWTIFNLGAVIGSLVPLAINTHATDVVPIGDSTYIVMMCFMAFGGFLPLIMVEGKDVVRSDGSWVTMPLNPTWSSEIQALWSTLRTDVYVVLLFPMFFCSNWFYTYQFNGFNLAHFDLRTRTLNNLVYWIAQIAGALLYGYTIDTNYLRRTTKARISWIFIVLLTTGVWGGGYAWQLIYGDRPGSGEATAVVIDWHDRQYWNGMFLYVAYGFFDAVWQSSVYWYMGALTNSGRKSANFVGFYKGIQSAGAAIAWQMDAWRKPYMTEFLSNWILLSCALVCAAPVIWFIINDHNLDDEEESEGPVDEVKVTLGTMGKPLGIKRASSPSSEAVHEKAIELPRLRPEPRNETHLRRSLPYTAESDFENFMSRNYEQADYQEELSSNTGSGKRPISGMTLQEAVENLDPENHTPEPNTPISRSSSAARSRAAYPFYQPSSSNRRRILPGEI